MRTKSYYDIEWSNVEESTDFRGNTIRVGDTVVYPKQTGDTLEMRESVVLEILVTDGIDTVFNLEWPDNGGPKFLDVEAPYYKYRLQPIRSSRYNAWQGNPKAVWIQNGMNVVKVEDSEIRKEITHD